MLLQESCKPREFSLITYHSQLWILVVRIKVFLISAFTLEAGAVSDIQWHFCAKKVLSHAAGFRLCVHICHPRLQLIASHWQLCVWEVTWLQAPTADVITDCPKSKKQLPTCGRFRSLLLFGQSVSISTVKACSQIPLYEICSAKLPVRCSRLQASKADMLKDCQKDKKQLLPDYLHVS